MLNPKKSKLTRISRNLKRGGSNEQNKPRFKKRDPNHDGPSAPKVKGEGGSCLKVLSLLALLMGRSTLVSV